MNLAVLSYPKHYHITQLAVKHALTYLPNIKKVYVVWDDSHNVDIEMPLNVLLKRKLGLFECPIIKWSDIIPNIKGNNLIKGNVGQQIIKLHLDLMIKDEFIILDGDTIINHPIDPANILYSNRLSIQHSRYNFINHVLGIPNYEFWTNTFMYVKAKWLTSLRDHVEAVTGKSIADIFEYDNKIFPVYEWELIGRYLLDILKLPLKVEYFDKNLIKTGNFEKNYTTDYNIVLDGADDFSQTFMEKLGITVDNKLMMQLQYLNAK